MRAELGAQLHLLGCLLQLVGDVSEEQEWSRDCDGKQLWEVTGRGAAQVQAQRPGVFELVADVQGVVFLGDVAVDGLGVGLVLVLDGRYAVVPSLIVPPAWVKWLPWLEYVAGRCRNLEYVLIVQETGPRKK